ncbi:aminotransferase [Pterulicium gracile]|uniref:Aminotransferase n=1 Tax=Pterulicium gracile TaxID=1884261 RepID=A0A5C3QXS6_9AGAR|nr:aminotransferase [Pterula gracilis]
MEIYELLSCTRWDPFLLNMGWNNDREDGQSSPFLLLHYHLERLVNAADIHEWPTAKAALNLDDLRRRCLSTVDAARADEADPPKALKLRITVRKEGAITITSAPIKPLLSDPTSATFFNPLTDSPSMFGPIQSIFIDTQPTTSSIHTFTKTTLRDHYDQARSRAKIPSLTSPADVVLHNNQHLVTETSISNVAVWRQKGYGSYWITPHTNTGCLPGVLRRWLLEQGRIREAMPNDDLSLERIRPGDWLLLFNGVHGCRLGRVEGGGS